MKIMNIEKTFENYVEQLSNNYEKIGSANYLLITLKNSNDFCYNSATDYIYLLEFLDNSETNMTPQRVLEIELAEQNRTIGAIYIKKNNKFELLVKKGF